MLGLVTGCFLRVPFEHRINVYTKLGLCASWLIMEDPVVRNVPPRSRRFLSEKQGMPSPRAAKWRGPAFHRAAKQSEKTPDPFCYLIPDETTSKLAGSFRWVMNAACLFA